MVREREWLALESHSTISKSTTRSALITKGCLSKMDANPRETKLKFRFKLKICLKR